MTDQKKTLQQEELQDLLKSLLTPGNFLDEQESIPMYPERSVMPQDSNLDNTLNNLRIHATPASTGDLGGVVNHNNNRLLSALLDSTFLKSFEKDWSWPKILEAFEKKYLGHPSTLEAAIKKHADLKSMGNKKAKGGAL
jgi:hypothetical protein